MLALDSVGVVVAWTVRRRRSQGVGGRTLPSRYVVVGSRRFFSSFVFESGRSHLVLAVFSRGVSLRRPLVNLSAVCSVGFVCGSRVASRFLSLWSSRGCVLGADHVGS